METLEQTIIRTALPGFSVRECPGGFTAYVAKPEGGRRPWVSYVHRNTHGAIHTMTHNRVRLYAIGL